MAFAWEEGRQEIPLCTVLLFHGCVLCSNRGGAICFLAIASAVEQTTVTRLSFPTVCILRPSPYSLSQLLKPKGLLSFFWIPLDFLLIHLPTQIIISKVVFTPFVIEYFILWFVCKVTTWLLLILTSIRHVLYTSSFYPLKEIEIDGILIT